MLSPTVPYSLLKMHWTPEHAQPLSQWPEQHLDVSSTTSSPAHKSELYPNGRRSYSYAWANDDISALTASNLLKRYAEKYSGVLDSPYDRPVAGTYPEPGAFGGLAGQKGELEPWPLTHGVEGYPGPEGLTGTKVTAASVGLNGPGSGSAVNSNLSDPGYSAGSSCGGAPVYNGTYLSSGYCPQPGSALPPAPLHSLQPTAALVPSYTPPGPVYNYSHQSTMAPGYTHTPGSYLPSGLPAPTPLAPRPTAVGGSYGYQGHNLANTEPGGSLKRKAFEMTAEENETDSSRYRKYGYDHAKSGATSPFSLGDKGECQGNGFSTTSTETQGYKPGKPPSQTGLRQEEVSKFGGLKPLVSPAYSGTGEYSPSTGMNGENGGGENGYTQTRLAVKLPTPCVPSEDPLKGADPRLLELVTGELQDSTPALPWGELIGHAVTKAALEEDLLWPVLRPGGSSHPLRTILLFGPRGGGKTTLSRCVASQLGAAFFRLSGAALVSKWKTEAEKILHTLFTVARARQPSVVLISDPEALAEDSLRRQLLSYLETMQLPAAGLVVVACATRRPDLLDEATHRLFSKRYYVSPPDAGARRQVLLQALAPHGCCLSERELGTLLQRTEGFCVRELLQLCQQAASLASSPAPLHSLPAPLGPPTFKDFENAFCKVRPHATPKELEVCMEWSKMSSH